MTDNQNDISKETIDFLKEELSEASEKLKELLKEMLLDDHDGFREDYLPCFAVPVRRSDYRSSKLWRVNRASRRPSERRAAVNKPDKKYGGLL